MQGSGLKDIHPIGKLSIQYVNRKYKPRVKWHF